MPVSDWLVKIAQAYPSGFTVFCVAVSAVLLILSFPAVLFKLASLFGIMATGIYFLMQQVNEIYAAMQGLLRETFENIEKIFK
ncbi:hypothetical protein [Mahella australiensis]|uniref:Uncharacterized protein n=1 Tax=Mahella australiensis (strain DSM 15567 / CIP 107919 / 50-1 BON) TaxID=697281 RepID=F3ZWX6_MAHA5|nr:hypothetical protein [Mahella australiensis]AEE97598.1 hypothetical protein Mahau_2436 [Mahella australiensis 50-1 BON]